MTHGSDPQFVDPANWDLHLRCSDPIAVAIDGGTALGYAGDYEDVPIPQDGNHDATFAPDIGAYEMSCPGPVEGLQSQGITAGTGKSGRSSEPRQTSGRSRWRR